MVQFRQETGDVGGDVTNKITEVTGDGNQVTERSETNKTKTNSDNTTTTNMTTGQKWGAGIITVLVAKAIWVASSPDPAATWIRTKLGFGAAEG